MGQIELFKHLSVCKEMADIKLNCYCNISIPKTIQLWANEWVMLDRIISIKKQNMKLSNCVQIKLLLVDSKT